MRDNRFPPATDKVALTALKGDKTLAKLTEKFVTYPNQLNDYDINC